MRQRRENTPPLATVKGQGIVVQVLVVTGANTNARCGNDIE